MSNRPPFSEPSEPAEYVATTDARVPCDECGEWVYTMRRAEGGPVFFPANCQVCGAKVAASSAGETAE